MTHIDDTAKERKEIQEAFEVLKRQTQRLVKDARDLRGAAEDEAAKEKLRKAIPFNIDAPKPPLK